MVRFGRRRFLTAVGSAAVLSLVESSALAEGALKLFPKRWKMEHLTADAFEPLVGKTFRVTPADGKAVDLKLVRVHRSTASPELIQFSLLFEGVPGSLSRQGLCRLENSDFGFVQSLFLVPVVSRVPGVGCFEAAFSRFA